MPTRPLADQIFSAPFLEAALLRLYLAHGRRRPGMWRRDDRVSLRELYHHRSAFCRVLAKTIRKGAFRLSPAERTEQNIEGKLRVLYRSSLVDTVVISAAGTLLTQMVTPHLSPHVYSYQKGRSSLMAVEHFARYLKQHRQRPLLQRGLYVLKRDLHAYGESIATHDASRLWPLLDMVMGAQVPDNHPFRPLLRAMVLREVRAADGSVSMLTQGVPTGSAIQPALCNLYLHDLDELLGKTTDGVYLRYGDDFLFAHPSCEVTQGLSRQVDDLLERLSLQVTPHKRLDSYITGPGRPSAIAPKMKHCNYVTLLGCRVQFNGAIQLRPHKTRELLRDVQRRVRRSMPLMHGLDRSEIAQRLCHIVNRTLHTTDALGNARTLEIWRVVNDRACLRHLDYLIARTIACEMVGTSSVKAFRRVPYKWLRCTSGLRSLVMTRNRVDARRQEEVP
ncbi:MAG: reverse transcriptase domain-containing protein [Proteobacteria bacterium]|nr:reverse transcriptase domain-containing protein [Pseudomonadota bacterium]